MRWGLTMAPSLAQLEEALRLRRQIDALEKRLSLILGPPATRRSTGKSRRRMRPAARKKKLADLRPATRAKLSAAMKARWARLRKKSADLPTLNPGSKYRFR